MSTQLGGFKPWVMQRLTAIYLALFVIIGLGCIALYGFPDNYAAWRGLIGSPGINLAFLFGFFALLYHAWIGIRDVIVDYVHPPAIKFTVLTLFGAGLVACALWVLRVLVDAVA